MAVVPIVVPDLGEQVERVRIVKWLKAIGDAVAPDELVVAIATEKIDVDIAAASAGTLAEIHVEAGTWVAVGTTIGVIRVAPAPAT